MSPTIFTIKAYRFFFNSREETRRHVHIQTPDGTVKFWLEPTIALAESYGLKPRVVKQLDELVREHEDEIRSAWNTHFGQ